MTRASLVGSERSRHRLNHVVTERNRAGVGNLTQPSSLPLPERSRHRCSPRWHDKSFPRTHPEVEWTPNSWELAPPLGIHTVPSRHSWASRSRHYNITADPN